jgi:hypothetical protein
MTMPSVKRLSLLALLFLLGGMTACADRSVSDQHSRTQNDSMSSDIPPGDTPGGGGRY